MGKQRVILTLMEETENVTDPSAYVCLMYLKKIKPTTLFSPHLLAFQGQTQSKEEKERY